MNSAKIAKLTQISTRMLRHYEHIGLVSPDRSVNNYRNYSSHDVEKILKIKTLNEAGIPLKSIHKLIPCFDLQREKFNVCPTVIEHLEQQKNEIKSKISKLQQCYLILEKWATAAKT